MGDNNLSNKGYSRRGTSNSGHDKLDVYNTKGHPVEGDNHSLNAPKPLMKKYNLTKN